MGAVLTHNLGEVAKKLGRIPGDVDFAGAVALTRTAKLVQAAVIQELDDDFDLKNTWTKRGIRITPATKDKLEATVFSKDAFLFEHDEGGKRDTRDEYFIPGDDFERITGINPKQKVIGKKWRQPKLLGKTSVKVVKNTKRAKGRAQPFRFTTKSGANIIAVRETSAADSLAILYVTVQRPVNIRRRSFFKEPATKTYDAEFEKEYNKAYKQFVKLI